MSSIEQFRAITTLGNGTIPFEAAQAVTALLKQKQDYDAYTANLYNTLFNHHLVDRENPHRTTNVVDARVSVYKTLYQEYLVLPDSQPLTFEQFTLILDDNPEWTLEFIKRILLNRSQQTLDPKPTSVQEPYYTFETMPSVPKDPVICVSQYSDMRILADEVSYPLKYNLGELHVALRINQLETTLTSQDVLTIPGVLGSLTVSVESGLFPTLKVAIVSPLGSSSVDVIGENIYSVYIALTPENCTVRWVENGEPYTTFFPNNYIVRTDSFSMIHPINQMNHGLDLKEVNVYLGDMTEKQRDFVLLGA